MSFLILSNLAKIQKLKGRSNYQSWKSTLEGVLKLEGLWGIVSRKQPRPNETRTATPATRISVSATVTSSHLDTHEAWITIDVLIPNELRHITKAFSKEDPACVRCSEGVSIPRTIQIEVNKF